MEHHSNCLLWEIDTLSHKLNRKIFPLYKNILEIHLDFDSLYVTIVFFRNYETIFLLSV
jgi:hypothetical protein